MNEETRKAISEYSETIANKLIEGNDDFNLSLNHVGKGLTLTVGRKDGSIRVSSYSGAERFALEFPLDCYGVLEALRVVDEELAKW